MSTLNYPLSALNYPLNVCILENRCELVALDEPNGSVYTRYPLWSPEALLALLLNQDYYFLKANTLFGRPPDRQWPEILDQWDHDKVFMLINRIYFNDNPDEAVLSPSQCFYLLLAFYNKPFLLHPVPDVYVDASPISETAIRNGKSLLALTYQIQQERHLPKEEAFCQAGAMIERKYHVSLTRKLQYWFENMDELIRWLLFYIIEKDEYVKRCKFCGRYFIPERNTRLYCSDMCKNHMHEADGFCGETEIRKYYKRIVANLRSKSKQAAEKARPYIIRNKPEITYDPDTVLRTFYGKNSDYLKQLADAFKALHSTSDPSEEQKKEYENIRDQYLSWIKDQYQFATSLRLDMDSAT